MAIPFIVKAATVVAGSSVKNSNSNSDGYKGWRETSTERLREEGRVTTSECPHCDNPWSECTCEDDD